MINTSSFSEVKLFKSTTQTASSLEPQANQNKYLDSMSKEILKNARDFLCSYKTTPIELHRYSLVVYYMYTKNKHTKNRGRESLQQTH